jgi:hypothetical protein
MKRLVRIVLNWIEAKVWAPHEPPDHESIRKEFQIRRFAQSNDREVVDADPNRDELAATLDLWKSDPVTVLPRLSALAAAGSVWGMLILGYALQYGEGGTVDLALAEYWYRRAGARGCQNAQLRLGWLLEQRGEFAECEKLYAAGAADGWTPAMYYLAKAKLRLKRSRADMQEARDLLAEAAALGDLGAEKDLAELSARGCFGLRKIPGGLRSLRSTAGKIVALHEQGAFDHQPQDRGGRVHVAHGDGV